MSLNAQKKIINFSSNPIWYRMYLYLVKLKKPTCIVFFILLNWINNIWIMHKKIVSNQHHSHNGRHHENTPTNLKWFLSFLGFYSTPKVGCFCVKLVTDTKVKEAAKSLDTNVKEWKAIKEASFLRQLTKNSNSVVVSSDQTSCPVTQLCQNKLSCQWPVHCHVQWLSCINQPNRQWPVNSHDTVLSINSAASDQSTAVWSDPVVSINPTASATAVPCNTTATINGITTSTLSIDTDTKSSSINRSLGSNQQQCNPAEASYSDRSVDYGLTGDNLDWTRRPSVYSSQTDTESIHWFNLVAYEQRVVPPTHLDNSGPQKSVLDLVLPNSSFLPSLEEHKSLRADFIVLILKVLTENCESHRTVKTWKNLHHWFQSTFLTSIPKKWKSPQ